MEENAVINNLKTYMDLDGCTSTAFARKAGIDPSNFAKMLAGQMKITNGTLQKMCKSHGINPNWLLSGTGEMHASTQSSDNNTVNSQNNSTINSNETVNGFIALLKAKDDQIDRLLQQLADKDKLIEKLVLNGK